MIWKHLKFCWVYVYEIDANACLQFVTENGECFERRISRASTNFLRPRRCCCGASRRGRDCALCLWWQHRSGIFICCRCRCDSFPSHRLFAASSGEILFPFLGGVRNSRWSESFCHVYLPSFWVKVVANFISPSSLCHHTRWIYLFYKKLCSVVLRTSNMEMNPDMFDQSASPSNVNSLLAINDLYQVFTSAFSWTKMKTFVISPQRVFLNSCFSADKIWEIQWFSPCDLCGFLFLF